MSADEMFEKLGYEKIELTGLKGDIYGISYGNKNKMRVHIDFAFISKEICKVNYDTGETEFISMQELQVIYQKCKELGWLGKEN